MMDRMSNASQKDSEHGKDNLERRTRRSLVLLIDKDKTRGDRIRKLLEEEKYEVLHEAQMLGPLYGSRKPDLVITALPTDDDPFKDVQRVQEYYPTAPILATVSKNQFNPDLVNKATSLNIKGWITLENGPDKQQGKEDQRAVFLGYVQKVLEQGGTTAGGELDTNEEVVLRVLGGDPPTSTVAQTVLADHYIKNRMLWGKHGVFTGRFRNDVWRFTAGNFVSKVGPEEHKLELEREAKLYGILRRVNKNIKVRLESEKEHRLKLGKARGTAVSVIEQLLSEGDFIPTVELLSPSATAIAGGRYVLITTSGGRTLNKVLDELYDRRDRGEANAGEEADRKVDQLFRYAARIYAAHKLILTEAPTIVNKVVKVSDRGKTLSYYMDRIEWKFVGKNTPEHGSEPLFGGSLKAILEDRKLASRLRRAFRDYGVGIARYLAFAEPAIEMDVSPFNAAVDESGKIRLLDFGSVKNDGHWYTVGNILAATGFEPVFVPGQRVPGKMRKVDKKRIDELLKSYMAKVEDEARFIDPDLVLPMKAKEDEQIKEAYAFAVHRALTYAGNFFLWSRWTDAPKNFRYGVQCVEAAKGFTEILGEIGGLHLKDVNALNKRFFQPALQKLHHLETQEYKGGK